MLSESGDNVRGQQQLDVFLAAEMLKLQFIIEVERKESMNLINESSWKG